MSSKPFCLLVFIYLFNTPSIVLAQSCGNISLNDITNPGPYNYATMDQDDGLRNGPDYGNATVYYPVNASPPYASIAIVPGFFATQSSVEAWGPFLASHGIVSIIIDTNSLFDQPSDRADGLLDALETMLQENTRMASPLFGDLDTNQFAVMGWSMGGGGAQLAAVLDPSLKAVIALCPWLNTPTSSDLDHSVPVLIFGGELDPTAPPSLHSDVHYDLTPNITDKMLFEVDNGNHSVANDPANAMGDIGKYGLAWLRYYLLDDHCHCPLVLEPSTVTSEKLTNVSCPPIDCPTQVTLNMIISDGTYQADQTIIASSIVPAGGVVSLHAGQSICLDVGFSVALGADFTATIQGCQ